MTWFIKQGVQGVLVFGSVAALYECTRIPIDHAVFSSGKIPSFEPYFRQSLEFSLTVTHTGPILKLHRRLSIVEYPLLDPLLDPCNKDPTEKSRRAKAQNLQT